MGGRRIRSITTRAEDRATVGTDSSADPGAKTEGRADRLACSARSSLTLRDWQQSDKSLAAEYVFSVLFAAELK